MKHERRTGHTQMDPKQKSVMAIVFRLFVILTFTDALRDAVQLRGFGVIDGETSSSDVLFNRRVQSNILEVNDKDALVPTSFASDQGTRDLFWDMAEFEKLIVGGTNAGGNGFGELQKFVVGGSNAANGDENRFPWFVRPIGKTATNGLSTCGGALIAPDIIITAAHCDDPLRAMISPYNLGDIKQGIDGNMVRIDVVANRRHPDYSDNQALTVDNDVMISKLVEPVLDVAPIRLNFDDSFPFKSGETLLMLGFGSVIGGPETGLAGGPIQPSTILQEAPTDYVPFDECAVAKDPDSDIKFGISPSQTIVKDFWLCTLRSDTSSCFGDSGGPVIKEGTNADSDVLVGVISGAVGYCGSKLPLWNNRVSSHQEWIKDVGCELSTMPPAYWGCKNTPAPKPPDTEPPRKTDPPDKQPPDTKPPVTEAPDKGPSPTQPPATRPPETQPPVPEIIPFTQTPSTQPPFTAPPSPQPSSIQPTISASPTTTSTEVETFFDQTFWIITGASIGGVLILTTVGIILWKRRKNRTDGEHSSKNGSKTTKSDKPRKKDAGKDQATSSPATSVASDDEESKSDNKGRFPFFARFSKKNQLKEEDSIDSDLESQSKSLSMDGDSSVPKKDEVLDTSNESSEKPDDNEKPSDSVEDPKVLLPSDHGEVPELDLEQARKTTEGNSEGGQDLAPDGVDSSNNTAKNDKRKGFFSFLFGAKNMKSTQIDSKPTNLQQVLEPSVADASEGKLNDKKGTSNQAVPLTAISDDTESLVVQVDYDELGSSGGKERERVRILKESNSGLHDTESLAVQVDYNELGVQPTKQQRLNTSPMKKLMTPYQSNPYAANNFDDDIKSVIYRGRDRSPVRSKSFDRAKAAEYANKRSSRIPSRSLSQQRSSVNDVVRKKKQPQSPFASEFPKRNNLDRSRSLSKEHPFASEFSPRTMDNRRPRSISKLGASEYVPNELNRSPSQQKPPNKGWKARIFPSKTEEKNQSRGRSKERCEVNGNTLNDGNQLQNKSNERPDALGFSESRGRSREQLSRSKSLERNKDPAGDRYSRHKRSSSLDPSPASNFSTYNRARRQTPSQRRLPNDEKYLNQGRSSSLDRSGANNFANGRQNDPKYKSRNRSPSFDQSPSNNLPKNGTSTRPSPRGSNMSPTDTDKKQVSYPKTTIKTKNGERVVENGSTSGAVVTKNQDGSVVVSVKRRRADGALVTTKTKFANIRLARKYGVAI